ncbi:TetR/AcrR family transcriptional regulator C-terminal domain-containing protein [Microbacterium sp. NEAU-LLC]|uniref:TetR/AcrR family transcriptional regulator C-terminal domain-containing protein n=1 Tax=Microbacterium helvum TaxID=2773713 RepID=A0ABR8NT42_9MICO|nr:TetR/AcrR family transcriptional regulator C-terminal domain-containing protein [Microbacterium helvum]MBD3943801.1 TetR/AcrR family transcriptional regulator C-terminal domain-containing protein [Microbacterium helvum]
MTPPAHRPALTRAQIFTAALALVDADGAERLTMRRLGERLGVDPMAVYHHVPNKTAVLDGIIEHVWQGVELPVATPGEKWQDVVCDIFRAFRARLRQHPRAVAIVGTRPSATPAMLRLIDETLGRLHGTGLGDSELDGKDAMELIDCLSAFTIGKVLAETGHEVDGGAERVSAAMATVTPETHPHLVRTMAAGYELAPDEEFERGLRALVAGWR